LKSILWLNSLGSAAFRHPFRQTPFRPSIRPVRHDVPGLLLLDHDGLLPEFALITDGKAAGIGVARKFSFLKGSMVVFDRGYCDYDWFAGLNEGTYISSPV